MTELNSNTISEYYDEIYHRKGDQAMRPLWFYKKAFKIWEPVEKGAKLLDVGCGTGLFLKAGWEAGLQCYGLDISAEAVKIAQKNLPESKIVIGSGENLPFSDKYFDYVSCFGSLEHFLDLDKGMEEMIRVAENDAELMLVVPNKNYWLWKWRGEFGTKQKEMQEVLMDFGGWSEFFSKHGLKILKVTHDPWPWLSVKIFKKKNPWNILRRLVYRIMWIFVPLKSTYQFVFICKK
jgi:ubiquinone/menaquinone biosynthesis C-methylase UbiE